MLSPRPDAKLQSADAGMEKKMALTIRDLYGIHYRVLNIGALIIRIRPISQRKGTTCKPPDFISPHLKPSEVGESEAALAEDDEPLESPDPEVKSPGAY